MSSQYGRKEMFLALEDMRKCIKALSAGDQVQIKFANKANEEAFKAVAHALEDTLLKYQARI